MSARDRYKTAALFRTALEQRLRAEAQASAVPLNRLRKEAAFNRLLARLYRAAPNGWALKGGLALIARLGAGIRGTKDADANWRAARSDLEDTLSLVEELDLEDWFGFVVGDARPLQGEGAEGALRYSVNAMIDGRVFEQMSLDVNVIDPRDARPIELVVVQRNPFEFVGQPSLEIPMVTPGQQLAEKLHAYIRRYEDERSSRAKDLFDMLVIADQVQLPSGANLTDAVQDTFQVRTRSSVGERTVRELLATAAARREARESHAEQARAEQAARRQQQAAIAREEYLESLVPQEEEVWRRVSTLIDTKKPRDYDTAVRLLQDLRDMAGRGGYSDAFELKDRLAPVIARIRSVRGLRLGGVGSSGSWRWRLPSRPGPSRGRLGLGR